MSLTPNHGYFGRQQDIFDPMCFNFPMAPSPWGMHAPLPLPLPPPLTMSFSPMNSIEYEETPDTHLYRVRLPGKEDVRVRVEEGRVLHISARGAGKREERKDERGYYRMETSCGEFESKMKLPEDANIEYLTTFVDNNGLLTVSIPRDKLVMPPSAYSRRNY